MQLITCKNNYDTKIYNSNPIPSQEIKIFLTTQIIAQKDSTYRDLRSFLSLQRDGIDKLEKRKRGKNLSITNNRVKRKRNKQPNQVDKFLKANQAIVIQINFQNQQYSN